MALTDFNKKIVDNFNKTIGPKRKSSHFNDRLQGLSNDSFRSEITTLVGFVSNITVENYLQQQKIIESYIKDLEKLIEKYYNDNRDVLDDREQRAKKLLAKVSQKNKKKAVLEYQKIKFERDSLSSDTESAHECLKDIRDHLKFVSGHSKKNKRDKMKAASAKGIGLTAGAVLGPEVGLKLAALYQAPEALRKFKEEWKSKSKLQKGLKIASMGFKAIGAFTGAPAGMFIGDSLDKADKKISDQRKEIKTKYKELRKHKPKLERNKKSKVDKIFAAGGTDGPVLIKNKTNFTVGERGPEWVSVTPTRPGGKTTINGRGIKAAGGIGNDNIATATPVVSALHEQTAVLNNILDVQKGNLAFEMEQASDTELRAKGTPQKKDSFLMQAAGGMAKKEDGSNNFLGSAITEGLTTALAQKFLPSLSGIIPKLIAGPVLVPAALALLTAGIFTAGAFSLKKYFDNSGINEDLRKKGLEAQAKKEAEEARTGETPAKKNKDRLSYFGVSKETADLNENEFYGSYAKGGSFTTTGPGFLQVGEAGPEEVIVNPLSKGSGGKPLKTARAQQQTKPFGVTILDDKSKQTKELLENSKDTLDSIDEGMPSATGDIDKSGMSNIWSTLKGAISSPMQTMGEVKARMTPGAGKQNEALVLKELTKAGITDPNQQAIMMGQMAHESGGFTTMNEIGGGARYEGRKDLGNVNVGDGEKFKGRGFIQLTGRSNYAAAGKALGLPLTEQPELAAQPEIAARIATWYTMKRVNKKALASGDIVGVTKSIQGGRGGLEDRMARTKHYQQTMGATPIPYNASSPSTANVDNIVRNTKSASQESEATKLKTEMMKKKFVETEGGQTVNNITSVSSGGGGNPNVTILTGDSHSYANKLARNY